MSFHYILEADVEHAPDRIKKVSESVPADFVVSRSLDGRPLSQFKDHSWDLTPYGAKHIFYFDNWQKGNFDQLSETLTNEIKTISWLAQWNPNCVVERTEKASTHRSMVSTLKSLAHIAYYCGCTLESAHASPKFQAALKESIISTIDDSPSAELAWQAVHVKKLLRVCRIAANDPECRKLPKWKIVPDEDYDLWIKRLSQFRKYQVENGKRTPLIPTRIMAVMLKGIEGKLDTILPFLADLVGFYTAIYRDPRIWCDSRTDFNNNKRRIKDLGVPLPEYNRGSKKVTRADTLRSYGIEGFIDSLGCTHDLRQIGDHLSLFKYFAIMFIHLYTGMRRSEVAVMPFFCHKEINVPSLGETSVIFSYTTKLEVTNYSKLRPWVTSPCVEKAITVAQAIAKICWIRNSAAPFPSNPENVPLWMSPKWSQSQTPVHYDYPHTYTNGFFARCMAEMPEVEIQQPDIDELIAFDAFRDWDTDEDFAVGKPWPFHSHQARRSIAVYAARSGKVSLPSLATQFKHLTIFMTELYAENSPFARDFIADEDGSIPESHVVNSFRNSLLSTSSIAFEEQVIKTNSPLRGGQGAAFQAQKDRDMPAFIGSARAVQKDIANGKRKYTPLPTGGGCMRFEGPCRSYGIAWTFPCLGCAESVFEDWVLEEAADSLEFSMQSMSPNSLAFKFSDEKLKLIRAQLVD